MTHRLPPQNLEAEQCVIGALMIDPEAIAKVSETVNAQQFYRKSHRLIFGAATELFNQNQPIDLITLSDRLEKSGVLEEVGGVSYLATLAESIPTAANVLHYARIVEGLAARRDLLTVATETVGDCYGGEIETDELIEQHLGRVFSIHARGFHGGGSLISMGEAMELSIQSIEDAKADKPSAIGIPTGFRTLERIIYGWRPGELTILAARPSMGKTTMALNVALLVAAGGRTVPIFTCEMSNVEVCQKMLSNLARVDASSFKSGKIGTDEWQRVTGAASLISGYDGGKTPLGDLIWLDDTYRISVEVARARLRRLVALGHRPGMVIFDYIQIMGAPGQEKRDQVSHISGALKGLAKELNCHVLALSQLNRDCEKRQNKRPMLADLRDSGALEQDADNILFLYRDEVYNRDSKDKGVAEVIVGKQRNGKTGFVEMSFQPALNRFADLAREMEHA
ncbi:MAG: replicative DNA helicase [Candidatus Tectomicrobia bacterium]|nr:replicative DNA helicase [Candidatus Tectomicrobia bacterium]